MRTTAEPAAASRSYSLPHWPQFRSSFGGCTIRESSIRDKGGRVWRLFQTVKPQVVSVFESRFFAIGTGVQVSRVNYGTVVVAGLRSKCRAGSQAKHSRSAKTRVRKSPSTEFALVARHASGRCTQSTSLALPRTSVINISPHSGDHKRVLGGLVGTLSALTTAMGCQGASIGSRGLGSSLMPSSLIAESEP